MPQKNRILFKEHAPLICPFPPQHLLHLVIESCCAVACAPSFSLSPPLSSRSSLRVHVGANFVACLDAASLSLGKKNKTCREQLGLPVALPVRERLRLERARELQQNKSGGGSGLRLAG